MRSTWAEPGNGYLAYLVKRPQDATGLSFSENLECTRLTVTRCKLVRSQHVGRLRDSATVHSVSLEIVNSPSAGCEERQIPPDSEHALLKGLPDYTSADSQVRLLAERVARELDKRSRQSWPVTDEPEPSR